MDAQHLWDFLKTSSQTKILHSASQDVEVFDILLDGASLSHIFDTQLAARFLEWDASISLAGLVESTLNLHLEKSQTVSDWTKRPLDSAQLQYACEDVLFLHEIYDILLPQLKSNEKYRYFNEDCETMSVFKSPIENLCDKNIKITDSDHFKNMFRQLVEWREQYAKEKNIPKGWILKDHQLKKIIKFSNPEIWLNDGILSEKQFLRYKKTFTQIHHQNHDKNKKRHQITQSEKTEIENLQAKLKRLLNRVGQSEKIPTELLCNQRTLKLISESMILYGTWKKFEGWRGELINTKFNQIYQSLPEKSE
jgi:ribonuclease D